MFTVICSCCCGLSVPGEVEAAAAHLCQVFGQEPRDAVAQARLGVVEAWKQNYCNAACRLSKLTEKDSSSLDFLLALMPVSQRKHTAQVSLVQAALIQYRVNIAYIFLTLHCLFYTLKKNIVLLSAGSNVAKLAEYKD